MNLDELELKLNAHGKRIRNQIAPPFDIEREVERSMNYSKKTFTSCAVIVATICLFATSAFATYRYLTASEIAKNMGDNKLATLFVDGQKVSNTRVDGDYKATILGVATGEKLHEAEKLDWELSPEKTYVAVAVEKTDGTDMTYDDEILVTPLVQGLTPWKYNIFTFNGGMQAKIIDGILYRIVEVDSIECFADRNIYMAVLDGNYEKEAFNYDEKTGLITEKDDYNGTNMLFEIELDKTKANAAQAEKYLNDIEKNLNRNEEESDIDLSDMDDNFIGEEKTYEITEDDIKLISE